MLAFYFYIIMIRPHLTFTLFPYTTLFRSHLYAIDRPFRHSATAIQPVFSLPCIGHSEKTGWIDRKSTRLNSSHVAISYAGFCLKKKTENHNEQTYASRSNELLERKIQ